MQLIATATVGSGGSQIAFAGIPSTFTDLMILISARGSRASLNDDLLMRFNSDSGSNYLTKIMQGSNVNITATDQSTSFGLPGYIGVPAANANANAFGNCSIYITNYSGGATKRWTSEAVAQSQDAGSSQLVAGGYWNSTAAINRIDLFLGFTVMNQGSVASLYGITKGSGGASVA
jgi:hypothetical protein